MPFALGFTVGLLVVGFSVLAVLVRFVSSDLDNFRRWLDAAGAT